MFHRILEILYWLLAGVVVAGVLFFAAVGAARADSARCAMTAEMRADHDAYRAELHAERVAELTDTNGPYIVEPAHSPPSRSDQALTTSAENWTPAPAGVEQWRLLIERYFEPGDVAWALRVMACESGGNPDAYNKSSGASGLMQHLAKYFPDRAAAAGWAGADIFDPEANIAVAAWLFYTGGPGHWVCK